MVRFDGPELAGSRRDFVVQEMTVTFANIQNISVSQGPIQRLLGLSDLRVDTAGGAGRNDSKQPGMNLHTAWFRGIDNATDVRELMQDRLRQWKDAGLGDHGEILPEAQSQIPMGAGIVAALRELHAEACALHKVIGERANSTRSKI